jgi:hypothetical protein
MPVVRYDVIIIENGRPQPRKSFHAVDAAAAFIAIKTQDRAHREMYRIGR